MKRFARPFVLFLGLSIIALVACSPDHSDGYRNQVGISGSIPVPFDPTTNKPIKPASPVTREVNNAPESAPVSAAPKQAEQVAAAARTIQPGPDKQIISLRHISVSEMQKIVNQVLPTANIAAAEFPNNAVVLAGTKEERSLMLDVVNSFDVEWLSGMSFDLFALKEADARTLSTELQKLVGTQDDQMVKVVRVVSFDHLNSVLVASPQPEHMAQIKTWVEKLDVSPAPSERRIWVYKAQNSHASALRSTMQNLIHPNTDDDTLVQNTADGIVLPFAPPVNIGAKVETDRRGIPFPPTPAAIEAAMVDQQQQEAAVSLPRIISDENNNSLVIWATKGEFTHIKDALRKLDTATRVVRAEPGVHNATREVNAQMHAAMIHNASYQP